MKKRNIKRIVGDALTPKVKKQVKKIPETPAHLVKHSYPQPYVFNIENITDKVQTCALLDQNLPMNVGVRITSFFSNVSYQFILKEIAIQPFNLQNIKILNNKVGVPVAKIETDEKGYRQISGGIRMCYTDGIGRGSTVPIPYQDMFDQKQEQVDILIYEEKKESNFRINLQSSIEFTLQPYESLQVQLYPKEPQKSK